jgi:hypothetical protein
LAIDALREYAPGCSGIRLRNFGMTIGIRDTRKIDAHYNMTEDDVRHQARFEDSIGIYPEFIDGYGILILPTTGRYMHISYRSHASKRDQGVAGRGPCNGWGSGCTCRNTEHGLLCGIWAGRRDRRGAGGENTLRLG